MNENYLAVAIFLALMPTSQHVMAQENESIERIAVMGSYFNGYQVGNASGATRTDISLPETA